MKLVPQGVLKLTKISLLNTVWHSFHKLYITQLKFDSIYLGIVMFFNNNIHVLSSTTAWKDGDVIRVVFVTRLFLQDKMLY